MEQLWINGTFKSTRDKQGEPKTVTMPYEENIKTGVMDTLLIDGGSIHHFNSHVGRLKRHASRVGIHLHEKDPDDFLRAFRLMLNAERDRGTANAAFRGNILLVRKTNKKLYKVVKMTPYTPMPQDRDLRLCFSTAGQIDPGDIRFQVKHVDRSLHNAAMHDAKMKGADLAILLNTHGRVTCVDRGNIFARIAGIWVTPPVSEGVMDGITRARFMGENPVEERPLTPDDLKRSDELLVTNSLMGVRQARLIP